MNFFGPDFYPTTEEGYDQLVADLQLKGKKVLEPEAGKGDNVDRLIRDGAQVIACENNEDLAKILQTKCKLIAKDFLTVTSEQISHIDFIVMNPPFSAGAQHVLHAYNIAPPGCKIRALVNWETIDNAYSKSRQELKALIETYGQAQNIGQMFKHGERKTDVEVGFIRLDKPGANYSQEFEGFFMEEDPAEAQANGLMSYNAVRDLVNRYVECIKIYDQQLETAVRLNNMRADYFDLSDPDDRRSGYVVAISVSQGGAALERNEFKKRMQKSGWKWIFNKMNLQKTATKGLREDINKFVETQENVPFTMRNIYRMLDLVIQTTGQRMDKAILEVFDKITRHSHDNEYRVEGWKTNSHYLLTKRFISPSYYVEEMEDLVKALCFLTGENYQHQMKLEHRIRNRYTLVDEAGKIIITSEESWCPYYLWSTDEIERYKRHESAIKEHPGSKLLDLKWEYGQWFEWGFFRVRHYKKGTYHFEFKDENVWSKFNQHVARLRGYPLPEKKAQTKYQERQNGRKATQPAYKPTAQQPRVLSTIKL